jgi:hypothetical protein
MPVGDINPSSKIACFPSVEHRRRIFGKGISDGEEFIVPNVKHLETLNEGVPAWNAWRLRQRATALHLEDTRGQTSAA